MTGTRGCPVRASRDDHPAVAVPDQDDAGALLARPHVDEVVDMGVQAHIAGAEVGVLAEAGQDRGVDLVPTRAQQGHRRLPVPAAMPPWTRTNSAIATPPTHSASYR